MPAFDINIVFPILLGLLALFILREVLAWYWKINRVIQLLEKIEENTRTGTPKQKESQKPKKAGSSLFVNYQDQNVKKGFFG
ncbi:hypothetical protein KJ848_03015 [Patescibacteria group bacterium]|nr:hypothetical protein [Patescibacteria group bacterium]MBU2159128.1 hypothetical protein [Patescibacteria group bacterium]